MNLSEYAYKNIWEPALKNRHRYQHLFIQDTQKYIVWPNGVEKSSDNTIIIDGLGRCDYFHIKYWDGKCEHELNIITKFDVTRYNKTYLCHATFEI